MPRTHFRVNPHSIFYIVHVYSEHGESWLKEQSIVLDLYHEMCLEKNTFIKKEYIRKYPQDWQAYLETMADFVVLSEGIT